jgi:Bestrophin, RFP-TM, chloride channel
LNEKNLNQESQLTDSFPIVIVLQFFFYQGWMRAGQTMMNPFGDDDDDFEINNMIDKNLSASYLIVDEMHQNYPELLKDQYWDQNPIKLPDLARNDADEESFLKDADIVDYEIIRDSSFFGQRTTIVKDTSRQRRAFNFLKEKINDFKIRKE